MVRPESVEEVAEGPAAPVGPTVNELRSKLLREKPVMVVPKVTVEGVQDTSAVPSWFDEAAIDVGPGGVGPVGAWGSCSRRCWLRTPRRCRSQLRSARTPCTRSRASSRPWPRRGEPGHP